MPILYLYIRIPCKSPSFALPMDGLFNIVLVASSNFLIWLFFSFFSIVQNWGIV
jgi:hypothetical protein